MSRAGTNRMSVHMRRMMACVGFAALFALTAGAASAERQTDKVAFKGTVLTVKAAEERKKKPHAYKPNPAERVIIEPAATVPGVDVVDGVQVPGDLNETGGDPQVPGDLVDEQPDPLEGVNRVVFGFNQVVDRLILEPTARIY